MIRAVPGPDGVCRRAVFAPPFEYEQLRESGDVGAFVLPSGRTAYLVTRARDARAILTDVRLSSSVNAAPPREGGGDVPGWFFGLDGPPHAAVRGALARHFTARASRGLSPHLARMVSEVLDELGGRSERDLVADFCRPVARGLVRSVLGTTVDDEARVEAALARMEAPETPAEDWEGVVHEVWRAARLPLSSGRLDGDGLLARLLGAGELTAEEIVSVSVSLRIGATEPVVHLLSTTLWMLLDDDDLRGRFVASPGASAIQEFLRFVPTNNLGVVRVAESPVDVAGTTLPEGAIVFSSLPTANRDSDLVDVPEGLDLARSPNPHLSFGHGAHRCLGQHLAAIVAEHALYGFVERFPQAGLVVPKEGLRPVSDPATYALAALPVSLGVEVAPSG